MRRYPRTLLQLVTFGHVLVVVPFLLVTGYVFVTLDRLDGQYSVAIESFTKTSRLSSDISEGLLHMERSLRRYEVLKDAEAFDDYVQVRKEWQDDVALFANVPAMPMKVSNELQNQLHAEDAAFVTMRESGGTGPMRQALSAIKPRWQNVQDHVKEILDSQQAQFKRDADALRQQLLASLFVALVVAVLFIWLSRRLLARMIGRFERAIVRLGKGELQQRIALSGPEDLRWLGRWLEWLRRRLLSLEGSRARVLRHVSHELKGPLAALREGSNLLAEEVPGTLSAEQARIVHILQNNSKRLQDLIEGLLRLQQAEYAAERTGFETLRFDRLIEQVVDTYRLIANERQIEFEAVLAEVTVVAGREGLLTIVHNLLSNAVKFSPVGGCIRIELSRRDEHACLDVTDEGQGVDEEDKAKIFEPFYRSSASKLVAGVGLGLAITREFVLAYRGKLLLLDSPQGGAHFQVLLPLRTDFPRTP
jgi:two-component system, NtrC family, sensor histidine kinase GlrK